GKHPRGVPRRAGARDNQQRRQLVHRHVPVADHPAGGGRDHDRDPPDRALGGAGVSGRAVAAGTSLVGGVETRVSRSLPRLFGSIAAVAALLALVPLWVGDSRVRMGVAILGLAFACYAVGFNLIFGSTGQLFLCVGALAGVGGYGTALLADRAGVPLVAALIISTLGAALVGGLLSWVAVRRSLGVIFAGIITLIFALSFENLVLGASTITGGDSGIQVSAGSGTFCVIGPRPTT